jgi:nitric oxide dioxygenase
MTPEQIRLVQKSFEKLVPFENTVASFYTRLFELDPALRNLFQSDLDSQYYKATFMLRIVVRGLTRLDTLVPTVQALGQRHANYGVTATHYTMGGEALLWALRQSLGKEFTPQVEEAWTEAYTLLAQVMQEAAASNKLIA